jgi:inner membrane protein CreD
LRKACQPPRPLGPVRIADIYGADGSEIGCCARTGPLSGPELGLGVVKDRPLPFAFDLSLGGSHRLLFAPLGMETRVGMTSAWPDPSFIAAYLPASREIGPKGFTAR